MNSFAPASLLARPCLTQLRRAVLIALVCGLPAQAQEAKTEQLVEAVKTHFADVSNKAAGGAYPIYYNNKKIDMMLRDVHADQSGKLANGFYFICGDFKGSDGNTYDLDLYLTGTPAKLVVTQVGVHKINDRPLYEWKQQGDRSWVKIRAK